MSALTPHIRVLRALVPRLEAQAAAYHGSARDVLTGLMEAIDDAAMDLEAHERELESRLVAIPPRSSDK